MNQSVWNIIPAQQARTIRALMRGEEGAFFRAKIAELQKLFDSMPRTYETDGQGDGATVHLHYFTGSADWYIVERDQEEEQQQAFGLADLFGDGGEVGYISLQEIATCASANIDLHWTPCTLAQVRAGRLGLESVDAATLACEAQGAAVQKKIADRAARPISGDAGDLTATLPGLEGASDIPLFTENDVGRVAAV